MTMGPEGQRHLHVVFFPFMAPGHMIPMVDMAKLFSSHGVKSTIITTPANAITIQATVDRANTNYFSQLPIDLHIIHFPPAADTGLPDGCESVASLPSRDYRYNFFNAVRKLRQPFIGALEHLRPDCVICDFFFPWTLEAARELNIPRVAFHGTSFFSHCAIQIIDAMKPHKTLPANVTSFVIPGLPGSIEMMVSQILDEANSDPQFADFMRETRLIERSSYGVVVNSFYELEKDYIEYYKNVMGIKAWGIGPVSLCNKDAEDKLERGEKTNIEQSVFLNWLNKKKPSSVVYVSFGSVGQFTPMQMREIALGLEASGQPFIYVTKTRGLAGEAAGESEWLPEGFEERLGDRGLIVDGWAPQILILNHPAVGGLVTHCGWNSTSEGVSAGVPMVTWPLFAEQFYNERLIVDVLKIGVAVGAKKHTGVAAERPLVTAAEVEAAVRRVMGGDEEAEQRRRKAKEVGEAARKAVEEGGSSYVDMENFIQEMMERRSTALESSKKIHGG